MSTTDVVLVLNTAIAGVGGLYMSTGSVLVVAIASALAAALVAVVRGRGIRSRRRTRDASRLRCTSSPARHTTVQRRE